MFSVSVGGKSAFRSEAVREGMVGAPVNVDLGGATEFSLEVGDVGDGISCDQADWAEAQAVLNDGTVVWLGDLPLVEEDPCTTTDPPFSFVYDDQPSRGRIEEWGVKRDRRQLDTQRTEHTLTYTDPKTGLVVRAVAIEYHDFPTVEWTLFFRNTGTVDTPLLTDIQAIDTSFHRGKDGEFTLHHNTGSPAGPNDYQPHAAPLRPQATQRITTSGGRSTNSDMPYFNIAWPSIGRDRPQQEGLDWTQYQRMVGQWRRVCDYLLGDYYPLTPYSLESNVWMAWQFDRPERGEGMVQAFRRSESPYESACFPLRGLEADTQYVLTDLDTGCTQRLASRQLMQDGLRITTQQRPQAAVLLYQKVP